MRVGLALLDQLLVERVGDLDALLFERQLAQVAPAGGALLLVLLVVVAVSVRRRVRWLVDERACERVELTQLGRELDLQLRGIDALGLGDEDASLEQLELLPQPCVRGAELIALLGQRRYLRVGNGQLALERGDASVGRCRRVLAHHARIGRHARLRCRSPARQKSTCRQCTRVRRRGAAFDSTSMPSRRSSSARSSIATLVASASASGRRKVPLSSRL